MIKGIGIDLVELQSIKELTSPKFVGYILSADEKVMYENLVTDEAKIAFLGGRYAAKEAIFKAIKTGKGTTTYSAFSILNHEDGSPYVKTDFFSKPILIHISITHTDHFAIAQAILEE